MGTATSNQAYPRWRILYEAAILEVDPNKILPCIAEAEGAVMDRIEDLKRSAEESEGQALLNALNVLRDLRHMATEKRK